MEISSKLVADLRAETGVGMMDCKRALVEASGDFEEAKKILRKRGLAAAARKADRAASEGLVVARVTPKAAVLLELNCETDFVARTTDFRDFADGLADQIAAHDAFGETRTGDPAELGSLPANDRTTETVADVVSHLVAKLGENIAIRRFARLVPRAGERFASYVHGHGRIGVLVDSAPRSIRSTTSPTTRRSFPNRSRWDGRRRVRPSAWRRATSWALSPGRTFGEYPVDTDDPGDYAGLGHPVTPPSAVA